MSIRGGVCEFVRWEDIFGDDPLHFDPTPQNLSLMVASGILLSAVIILLVIPVICFCLKKSIAPGSTDDRLLTAALLIAVCAIVPTADPAAAAFSEQHANGTPALDIGSRAMQELAAQKSSQTIVGTRFKVKISPELSFPYDDFSDAFYEFYANRSENAREIYRMMETAEPMSPRPALEKGILCYELKYFSEAVKHFHAAGEIDPGNVHALYDEGLAREMNGEREAAVELYRAAAEMNPSFKKNRERQRALENTLAADHYAAARRFFENQDWSRAIDGIETAQKYAAPGSLEEADMRNLRTLATSAAGGIRQRKARIRNAFLARKFTYDDVYDNGTVRQTGADIVWTGRVRKINDLGRETMIVAIYTTGRGAMNESNRVSDTVRAKYFQVHCGRPLGNDSRIDEDAIIEVYGKLLTGEPLLDGYKYGASGTFPAIEAYKLTFRKPNVTGDLIFESLN